MKRLLFINSDVEAEMQNSLALAENDRIRLRKTFEKACTEISFNDGNTLIAYSSYEPYGDASQLVADMLRYWIIGKNRTANVDVEEQDWLTNTETERKKGRYNARAWEEPLIYNLFQAFINKNTEKYEIIIVLSAYHPVLYAMYDAFFYGIDIFEPEGEMHGPGGPVMVDMEKKLVKELRIKE